MSFTYVTSVVRPSSSYQYLMLQVTTNIVRQPRFVHFAIVFSEFASIRFSRKIENILTLEPCFNTSKWIGINISIQTRFIFKLFFFFFRI